MSATGTSNSVVWRLMAYVARHKGLIVMSVGAMIAAAAADLALPELVKRAMDGPILTGDLSELNWISAGIFGVLTFGAMVRAAQTVLSVRAGRLIGMSLRMDVFQNVQRQGLRFFDKNPVGVLTTRVTGDIDAIENFFASGVAAVFHDVLKLLLVLVVLFILNAKLAWALVAVLPLLVISSAIFSARSRRDFRRVRAETAQTNGFTNEGITGISVTRLFQREARAVHRYDSHVDGLMGAHLATVRNFAYFFPTVKTLESLAVALVVQFGAKGILDASFTFGEFFQFWLLIDIFFEPIRKLSDNLNLLLQAGASGERVFAVLDHEPEISAPDQPRDARAIRGAVTFDDVHFAYNEDEPVLRGVSFDVPDGTTVAIVGPTGAGKSSILNLVSRFYDVQRGAVRVDGKDVREYDPRTLRSRIAIVLQDVFLFRGSVLENIRLFDTTISREQVERAVRAVHAEGVIARLPDGLDSPIEERGSNLSVGERQLLAFARAVVHDPAVLVLDEATSSIDTATEQLIQKALDRMRKGRTTIVVAHRLSTIRSADQILVLQRGQVHEQGDHASLLERDGLYRKLYQLQVRQQAR